MGTHTQTSLMATSSAFLKRLGLAIGVGGPTVYGVVNNCFFTVDAGEAAVMQNEFDVPGLCTKGVEPEIYGPGLHVKLPYIQSPFVFETRTGIFEIAAAQSTRTSDQQQVNIKLRVLCRPEVEQLPFIFQTYGQQHVYKNVALPGRYRNVLPSVVARYTAEDLIVRREEVSLAVSAELKRECEQVCKIIVEDVAIVDCQFSREWQESVEAKQVAQQDAEREKFIVMQNEQKRRLQVVYSEAQSEAGQIINDAMKLNNGEALLQLRQIEAARDIAKTMSKSGNVSYLPGADGSSDGTNMLLRA